MHRTVKWENYIVELMIYVNVKNTCDTHSIRDERQSMDIYDGMFPHIT